MKVKKSKPSKALVCVLHLFEIVDPNLIWNKNIMIKLEV